MRNKLKELGTENRKTFTGTFERFGWKSGYKGDIPTVLLLDIKDCDGNTITDHLWFNKTKGFEKLNLVRGDIVQFNARVSEYIKGYFGYRENVYKPAEKDYRLTYPTKLIKIEKE